MKKIFTFFAALTLSVGLWAQDGVSRSDAIITIKQAAADAIAEIQSASSAESVKYIQDDAILNINQMKDFAIARINTAEERSFGLLIDWALTEINTIKNRALADIEAAIESQNTTQQTVSYLYPVYNDPNDVSKGIASWETTSVDATEVKSSYEQVTWDAGWYVVTGRNIILSKGAVCNGVVHLILADGAKLTATGREETGAEGVILTAGIQVSGEGNAITIYGQDEQSGQLIATGGMHSAGIGGSYISNGSNIIINGGTITATGGKNAAGIGGGIFKSGSNITINGGVVKATGGERVSNFPYGDAIGNGINSQTPSSNIYVADALTIKADNSNPPTTVIADTRTTATDIATDFVGKRYAIIEGITATGLINVNANSKFKTQNSKFIKDGQLFIRRGDKNYTIMGLITNH